MVDRVKILCFILVFSLLLSLTACTTAQLSPFDVEGTAPSVSSNAEAPAQSYILPHIEEHYWDVFDTNCHMVYEPGFMATSGIRFTLLSASSLEESDVAATANPEWTVLVYLEPYNQEQDAVVMSEDIFLLYQGVSSVSELREHQQGMLQPERTAQINDWIKAYRALDDRDKPAVYHYVLDLVVSRNTSDPDSTLTSVDITVHGETRSYDIGLVADNMADPVGYTYDPNFALNCNDNVAYFGHHVDISKDGTIHLENIMYTADQDVTLTGIRFYNGDEIQIQEVSIVQTSSDGSVIDTLWDMEKTIALSAGASIRLNVTMVDPFFASTLGGSNTRYLLLSYQSDGKEYELGIPFYFVQSLWDSFAYIAMEDGLDIVSYYCD